MKYLLLLFPLMVMAQPNFSISKWEYKRRVDNIRYLNEIILDMELNKGDHELKLEIIANKDLALLQQLEAKDLIKRQEKANEEHPQEIWKKRYKLKKYFKNLNPSELNTDQKRNDFYTKLKEVGELL